MIAFGYARVDDAVIGLNETERLRLKAAETLAKQQGRGMWTERPGSRDRSFRRGLGLNVSDALHLKLMINFTAEEIAEKR